MNRFIVKYVFKVYLFVDFVNICIFDFCWNRIIGRITTMVARYYHCMIHRARLPSPLRDRYTYWYPVFGLDLAHYNSLHNYSACIPMNDYSPPTWARPPPPLLCTACGLYMATIWDNLWMNTNEGYWNIKQRFWNINQGSNGYQIEIERRKVTNIDYNTVALFKIHSKTWCFYT